MKAEGATHLAAQDRAAFILRIAGAVTGFAVIAVTAATSSWGNRWVLAVLLITIIGGAVAYYLLTSIAQCPSCRNRMHNFEIGSVDAKRKLFSCSCCGAMAWIAEGFYWQRDVNG